MIHYVRQNGWRRKGYDPHEHGTVIVSNGRAYLRLKEKHENVTKGWAKATAALERARANGDWVGERIAELQIEDCRRLDRELAEDARKVIRARIRPPSPARPVCVRINTNRNTRARRSTHSAAKTTGKSLDDPDGPAEPPGRRGALQLGRAS